jgi:endonuclease/exonuclease/phosphatase family metal-dependent hydrolase
MPLSGLAVIMAASVMTMVADEAKPLRVMCWNIHRCVGMDGKLDIARTATVISKQAPEVALLQEVDQGTRRSSGVDQSAELARLTGMKAVFGKALPFDGGAYGLAILSRHPIKSSKVHPLPGNSEPRIVFEVVISIDGRDIRFLNTHFDLDAATRLKQAEHLVKMAIGSEMPTILAGDINATPESPPILEISKHFQPAAKSAPALTYPADKPDKEIDYFFLKEVFQKEPLAVIGEAVASDHRPLLLQALFSQKIHAGPCTGPMVAPSM